MQLKTNSSFVMVIFSKICSYTIIFVGKYTKYKSLYLKERGNDANASSVNVTVNNNDNFTQATAKFSNIAIYQLETDDGNDLYDALTAWYVFRHKIRF